MTRENVLLKHEEKMSRAEVASILETIASKLREDGTVTIHVGETTQTINPSDPLTFEIELEEKNGKYELELELEWRENESGKQTLSIE